MSSFVLNADDKSFIEASSNSAYNFGKGPFTIEVWVHTTACGPLITRKPHEGGKGKTLQKYTKKFRMHMIHSVHASFKLHDNNII